MARVPVTITGDANAFVC